MEPETRWHNTSAGKFVKTALRLPHGSPDLVELGGPARTPVESRGELKRLQPSGLERKGVRRRPVTLSYIVKFKSCLPNF